MLSHEVANAIYLIDNIVLNNGIFMTYTVSPNVIDVINSYKLLENFLDDKNQIEKYSNSCLNLIQELNRMFTRIIDTKIVVNDQYQTNDPYFQRNDEMITVSKLKNIANLILEEMPFVWRM